MKIRNVAVVVRKVLEREPITRSCDGELIMSVYEEMGVSRNLPFIVIMNKIKRNQIPSLESITRARRKAQEENPELRAREDIEEYRTNNKADYMDFAIKGIID